MRNRHRTANSGFTLIEVLITLVVSSVIMTGVYTAFEVQQKSYVVQEQVAEVQQNIRAGLDMMVREIRMAGFDPSNTAGAGITTANAGQISFSQDINGDGDTADSEETIDYGFTPVNTNPNYDVARDGIPDVDSNGDGVPDAMALGRQVSGAGGYHSLVENIQAIEFSYLDEDGNVTATPADIRTVQISILARARRPDPGYRDSNTYVTASGVTWGPYNDSFRRRFETMTVKCRNLGL